MSLFKKHFEYNFEYDFLLEVGDLYQNIKGAVWKIIAYDIGWNFDDPNDFLPEYRVELISIGVDPFMKFRREPGYKTIQNAAHIDAMIKDGVYKKVDLTYEIET